ncbi:non-ribosomal peptide synthetase, partial [Streptomyces sp. NPDC088251]
QLAYIMHTSGSTGTPKGIAATHQGVVDLALDPCWEITAQDRILLQAPHAFDGSTYELWAPLLAGATIVTAPPGHITDATTLHTLTRQHHLTRISLTAGLFRVIAENDPAAFNTLKEITTGGDIIPPEAVHAVLTACPHTTVRTTYGPTEITMCATHTPWHHHDTLPPTTPLGQPLTGTHLTILDNHLQPTPPGVTGELYIAGTGLARGYTHNPALTATHFTANPHGTPGERIYRTGDLARWEHNGTLTFHGRTDHQIKIRGYRIEPAEIETALTNQPGVTQATTTIHTTPNGDKQLTAYYTGTTTPTHLRTTLTTTLPDYLIPTHLIPLTTWPLTTNGKLDHTQLPTPQPTTTGRPPRTPHEQTLATLFTETLNLTTITIDDNFFDLGGHSLLAIRLTNRINTTLNTHTTIHTLFQHPTIADL